MYILKSIEEMRDLILTFYASHLTLCIACCMYFLLPTTLRKSKLSCKEEITQMEEISLDCILQHTQLLKVRT